MTILLEAQNLSRFFGPNIAVQDIDITVKRGEVLGFLGPNGAGKSTTMKMLSGNLAPDKGEIRINGFDLLSQPKQAKAQLGYLPETPPLYRELTVREYLQHCARLNGLTGTPLKLAVATVIERCGLGDVSRRLIGQLSKGYQQRTGIAQAIVHTPAVVILDEPTSGLDPQQIRQIRELIREIANEHSVILSTHILPEVEMLCDRVQIISKGQVVFADSLSTLHQQRHHSSLRVILSNPPSLNELYTLDKVSSVEALSSNQFRIIFHPEQDPTESLLANAVSQQWQMQELVREQDSLEDIFMQLINTDPSTVGANS
ncbi:MULTISPECIES: ABC transporter ATP-binding protein [unclassified Methylophaga]|uniref:ABC transporter ATP-binding protein n=1 Tax=unclassified Methylophaga TaxID=2629249 RepID=UPI000C9558EE|nr:MULTISPECIES: ABC transporter ATP-binding protein [unclassified Methylophaga]MBN46092.1 ABC transporter ATP-binding protein [Methylophaga sp.]|tara:strand:- start:134506 stop:135450 length:945 start_codon:yes stop_codon:yes gene_type:complete